MPRNDYTPAQRAAWQAQRLAGERARGAHSAGINALPRAGSPLQSSTKTSSDKFDVSGLTQAQQDKWTAVARKIGSTPSAQSYEAARQKFKEAQQKLSEEVNRAIADKAPKHATLEATLPSTCLASLTWKDGIATAEFYRGGDVVYEYPMTRDEFVDWASDSSLGKYGNAYVFD